MSLRPEPRRDEVILVARAHRLSSLAMSDAVSQTSLPYPVRRGKVRDVYDLGDKLLIVATDRISAFDCVLPDGIPDKGKILTALSLFWFSHFAAEFQNHLITADVRQYPANVQSDAALLAGRSMLVKKASVVPIECVARGYLAGSGWAEYQAFRHRLRCPASQRPAAMRPLADAYIYSREQSRAWA